MRAGISGAGDTRYQPSLSPARAAELIRMCREKIDQTEFQVRTIIEELDGRDED